MSRHGILCLLLLIVVAEVHTTVTPCRMSARRIAVQRTALSIYNISSAAPKFCGPAYPWPCVIIMFAY